MTIVIIKQNVFPINNVKQILRMQSCTYALELLPSKQGEKTKIYDGS